MTPEWQIVFASSVGVPLALLAVLKAVDRITAQPQSRRGPVEKLEPAIVHPLTDPEQVQNNFRTALAGGSMGVVELVTIEPGKFALRIALPHPMATEPTLARLNGGR